MMKKPVKKDRTIQEGSIRGLERRDRSRIAEIIVAAGRFNDREIKTALELVDEALEGGEASGYFFVLLEHGNEQPRLKGYACYGPAPLTQGTYDLYWIVVDPSGQRKGFGRRLLEFVEHDAAKRGGRMLLIETSSQESYISAILFYRRSGYRQVARIKNFYRIGDDKLVFMKELASNAGLISRQ
jgi:ribosomal protein S18 acetylase RimI-like enzyme